MHDGMALLLQSLMRAPAPPPDGPATWQLTQPIVAVLALIIALWHYNRTKGQKYNNLKCLCIFNQIKFVAVTNVSSISVPHYFVFDFVCRYCTDIVSKGNSKVFASLKYQ